MLKHPTCVEYRRSTKRKHRRNRALKGINQSFARKKADARPNNAVRFHFRRRLTILFREGRARPSSFSTSPGACQRKVEPSAAFSTGSRQPVCLTTHRAKLLRVPTRNRRFLAALIAPPA